MIKFKELLLNSTQVKIKILWHFEYASKMLISFIKKTDQWIPRDD